MKNKILLLLPILLITFAFVSAIDVSTCSELQNMNNDLNGDYFLLNDIDCSDTINWNGGAGFIPIGLDDANYDTPEYGFNGTFDGQGYTIDGLYINNNSRQTTGLFIGLNSGASVSNVHLTNVDFTGGYEVGGITGWNFGTIEDSSVQGDITATSISGGVFAFSFGIINKCYSYNGIVTTNNGGGSNAGGLGGFVAGGYINNSWSNMEVIADRRGGLLGYLQSASAYNSFSYGEVNGGYCLIGAANGGNGANSLCDVEASHCGDTNICSWISWSGEGVCNKSTSEMKNIETYEDYGWTIIPSTTTDLNNGYPYLLGGDWYIWVYSNTAPEITNKITSVSVQPWQTFYYDYDATDLDFDDDLVWSDNSTLFNIDISSGLISFTPNDTQIGTYQILITVSDGAETDTDEFTFTIESSGTNNNVEVVINPQAPLFSALNLGTFSSIDASGWAKDNKQILIFIAIIVGAILIFGKKK